MSDFKLVFKENDEKCYRSGPPDALLIDMFHYNVGRNSNFFQLFDRDLNLITSSRANCWQFLLSNAKHYVIEVINPDNQQSIFSGPANNVVAALRGSYDDFSTVRLHLLAYPTWDKAVSKTVLCDNTVDTFKVLNDWFEVEEPEVKETKTDWKGLYISTELERIENLINLQDTNTAMEVIRKLVENVQK